MISGMGQTRVQRMKFEKTNKSHRGRCVGLRSACGYLEYKASSQKKVIGCLNHKQTISIYFELW